MKQPATPKAREMLAKLEALAERGINGEKAAAKKKLQALKRKWDFTAKNTGGADIFAGVFVPSLEAAPVIPFDSSDYDIANAVKWAIEQATGIKCLYRAGQLCAQAEPATANRLHDIAAQVAASFRECWRTFQLTPGVNTADRGNFVLGLYEGMMDEERRGEQLPSRPRLEKVKRARKRDLAPPAGLAVHPYSIGAHLGRQVRFSAPLNDLAGEIGEAITQQLTP